MFNQAAHQVDIVRLLGGGRVQERARRDRRMGRGASDRRRLFGAAHVRERRVRVAHLWRLRALRFGRISGLDRRDGAGEDSPTRARRSAFASAEDEAAFKNARNYGGASYQPRRPMPTACAPALRHAHRELRARRPAPAAERRDDLPGRRRAARSAAAAAVPRGEVIDELYDAVVDGKPPLHDGAWAMATLEVCLAILRSAREGRDIALAHQVGADEPRAGDRNHPAPLARGGAGRPARASRQGRDARAGARAADAACRAQGLVRPLDLPAHPLGGRRPDPARTERARPA